MRRLFYFLILAAFLLDISGGKVSRLLVKLPVRPSSQDCSQFSIYLPRGEPSKKFDVAEQPLRPPRDSIAFLEPSPKSLTPWQSINPTSLRHFWWLGLGSGALPS